MTRSRPGSWRPRSSRNARASSGESWAISASMGADTGHSANPGFSANAPMPDEARNTAASRTRSSPRFTTSRTGFSDRSE